MNNRRAIYLPLILAIIFVVGAYMGMLLSSGMYISPNNLLNSGSVGYNKLNDVMNYIEQEYVDTVAKEMLVDKTIGLLLQELDPHSYYIGAMELSSVNEPLEGNFEGVGIEFSIQNDTILVISPITGGPSEQVGIRAGDRIISVNDTVVAGTELTNERVMKLLRGKKGTKVSVGIKRKNAAKMIDFTITRDAIPIHSVDVSLMLNDTVGYLKLSRFSRTTYDEFMQHASKLQEKGMTKLVLDLRNNGGGYLDQAVKLADEFLEEDKLIVFTKGKARPRRSYSATRYGDFEQTGLTILIDEGTASASEIIAGAIQDNERGLILGRRSYGKGLVQEQSAWPDGSAIRLTIARYYTPSGRSIQTSYAQGSAAYHLEQYNRMGKIELGIDSSIFPDSLKYYTSKGRVVYGGGGIYPDLFVPSDTAERTLYFLELLYNGVIREFCLNYIDVERPNLLNRYKNVQEFSAQYQVDAGLLKQLYRYAEGKEIVFNAKEAKTSNTLISNYVKANLARYLYGNEGFYTIFNKNDKLIKEALR